MQVLLKILLSPFSVLYGLITYIRNKLFDYKILKSVSFDLPVICVGNINTGGTGKSPLIEILIRILQRNSIRPAILSRGYGRITKGFLLASKESTALSLGDEPLQFHQKFPGIIVSVCEDRVKGIQNILKLQSMPDIILLDDAFQHRRVKPGLNILLTDYSKLYVHDNMLPSGRLREFPSGANRADIIIITKSPKDLSEEEKYAITRRLKVKPHQDVFYSFIRYGQLVPFFKNPHTNEPLTIAKDILLFSGIANPGPLEIHLKQACQNITCHTFSDHHAYTTSDLKLILQKFRNIVSENKMIITTEKDFNRLMHHPEIHILKEYPLYYLPMEMAFQEDESGRFEQIILNYARKNQ
jgi:tetraacyldisaccharide 4'-kinase